MNSGLFSHFGKLLRHPAFLCATSFVVCFLFGLLLFLPLEPFTRHLEQIAKKQGIQLQIDGPKLRFPFGFGAGELAISHPRVHHPPFLFQEVDLRPLWLTLLGSNPAISFAANAYQGDISGTAYRDGTALVTLRKLQFEEPVGAQLPMVLTGFVTKGVFEGTLPLAGKNQSSLLLELDDLSLKGLQVLGSSNDILPLGRLSCTAEARGPLVQISNLSSSGPAFDLKGNGSLRLGRTPANSSLNLNLVLTPKDALDPTLKDLLSLLKKPQPDGSYKLGLRGGLLNLRIN